MGFQKIELANWSRREYYEHYFSAVPCTYSLTRELEITRLKASGEKLYPAMLYLLTRVINRHEEFRMALDGQGNPGVYDAMCPCYTVFDRRPRPFPTCGQSFTRTIRLFWQPMSRI